MTISNCSIERTIIECLLDAKALCQVQGKGIREKMHKWKNTILFLKKYTLTISTWGCSKCFRVHELICIKDRSGVESGGSTGLRTKGEILVSTLTGSVDYGQHMWANGGPKSLSQDYNTIKRLNIDLEENTGLLAPSPVIFPKYYTYGKPIKTAE